MPTVLLAALTALFAALVGEARADRPLLAPDDLSALAGVDAAGCGWRFVAVTGRTADGQVERWRAEACAARGLWNVQLRPEPDGRLAATVLLPGTTRQPPAVQRAATLALLSRAAEADCRRRRVVDTEVVAERADAVVERWTVVACGESRSYRLDFDVEESGLPAIALEPAEERASAPVLSR